MPKIQPILVEDHPHIHDYKETDFNAFFQFDNYKLSIDSGAHTLYNVKFAGASNIKGTFSRAYSKYDFFHSEEFKEYLNSYIEYLSKTGHLYDFYVTLDIIFEPKLSWDVTEYMESCGLNPIPVFHYGEDFSWLKRMLERYDYIGVGGLGQDITKNKFRAWGDKVFEYICGGKKKDGIWPPPICKVHGFAMAAPELIFEYPWYTCDSSTWTTLGRNGTIYIPTPRYSANLEPIAFDYSKPKLCLPVTARRNAHKRHADHLTDTTKRIVEEFLGFYGLDLQACKYDYDARDIANIWYFKQLEQQAKNFYEEVGYGREGGTLLFAGTPSGASTGLNRNINLYYKLRSKDLYLLNSFWYRGYMNNCMLLKKGQLEGKSLHEMRTNKKTASLKRRPLSEANPIPNLTSLAKHKIERKPLKLAKKLTTYKYAYKDSETFSIPSTLVAAPKPSIKEPEKEYQIIVEYIPNKSHFKSFTVRSSNEPDSSDTAMKKLLKDNGIDASKIVKTTILSLIAEEVE